MKKISPDRLIPMDIFLSNEPISIDLVYAQKNHKDNIFKKALYHNKARLWAHKDIAAITLLAARKIEKRYGLILCIQDCFRPIEAQESIQETDIVKANPQWMEEPRMLAPPGHGGHPRGMAIDVAILNKNGNEIDMGTSFDHMDNTAARDYTGFSDEILNNRKMLENAFLDAAKKLGLEILPLPSEWWDFRFPESVYNNYAPLSDADLPPQIQMTSVNETSIPDFPPEHFEKLKNDILGSLN